MCGRKVHIYGNLFTLNRSFHLFLDLLFLFRGNLQFIEKIRKSMPKLFLRPHQIYIDCNLRSTSDS